MEFIEFLHASRRIKTPEALCTFFVETMTTLGYDLINFSIIRAYHFPELHEGFGKINTYSPAWQQYYIDNNCRLIDPVAICATSMFWPFLWSDLPSLMRLTKRQRKFLRDAEAAGLHNGIGIPFKGPMCQVAGIALATSEKNPKGLPPLDLVVAYCNHFFEVYLGLVAPRKLPFDPDSTLTLRECQILELAGRNMIDVEIAEHLGIKASTVDSHMRSVFTKLQARTRTGAVITALKMGLIDP
jgi:DNA-binding CsgD family transcriptional regulator